MKNIKSIAVKERGNGHLKFPDGTLIPLDPLPEGSFIVHNNSEGCGYRIWIEEGSLKSAHFVRCRCDLGSDDATKIPTHYRYRKTCYSVWVPE